MIGQRIANAISSAPAAPALVAFVTAGYPERKAFRGQLAAISSEADVIEIGVPFTDPMADGMTIQRASRQALQNGVSLDWILSELETSGLGPKPIVLMSYLNPLLAFGFDRLAKRARASGVSGVIVPDLPLEECSPLRDALNAENIALIQLVTPVTPEDRLARLCAASQGFVYAVTVTGITGGQAKEASADALQYLKRVQKFSRIPVCAGFGVRFAEQAQALAEVADGIIVGSALIEAIEAGQDPADFLAALRIRSAPQPG